MFNKATASMDVGIYHIQVTVQGEEKIEDALTSLLEGVATILNEVAHIFESNSASIPTATRLLICTAWNDHFSWEISTTVPVDAIEIDALISGLEPSVE